MKTFEQYRALIGGANHKKVDRGYKYQPRTTEELKRILSEEIGKQGPEADLNMIDTSLIEDMSFLFDGRIRKYAKNFNGDISNWDVSNVTNMNCMFNSCKNFDGDISSWDVSNVENMAYMFFDCEHFNSNLSDWDVSAVKNMYAMFTGCIKFNSDLNGWDVDNVTDMSYMFHNCGKFNRDISRWHTGNVTKTEKMFDGCGIKEKYKPKFN